MLPKKEHYPLFSSAARGISAAWNYSDSVSCFDYNMCEVYLNVSGRIGTSYSLTAIIEKSFDNNAWVHFATAGKTAGSAGAMTSSVRSWYSYYNNIGAWMRCKYSATSVATNPAPLLTFKIGLFAIRN